jgi:hypothetical protein
MGVGGANGFAVVAWLLVIFQMSACASDLVFEKGRYRHRHRHYSIARPGGEESLWQPVRVEGTVLAFQGPARDTMSLLENCESPGAEPRLLARQLLIGLDEWNLLDEGPVGEGESPGWIQRLEATADGEAFQLKTVTRIVGQCSYDWILIVRGGLEGPEAVFDRWWRSFRSSASRLEGERDR